MTKLKLTLYIIVHHWHILNQIYSLENTFNPYSSGIDFSRQILTTKVDPRAARVKMFVMAVDP